MVVVVAPSTSSLDSCWSLGLSEREVILLFQERVPGSWKEHITVKTSLPPWTVRTRLVAYYVRSRGKVQVLRNKQPEKVALVSNVNDWN